MLHIQTVEFNTLELLNRLMSEHWLNHFRLVGGTALSLQIGHRISIDLDFFTNEEFDVDLLLGYLTDGNYEYQILQKSNNTLILNIDGIKVDFIRFRYPFLKSVVTIDNVRLAQIEDIASMKVDAIAGRGAMKDFFDLYFILKLYSLNEVLQWYYNLYKHQTLFHTLKSLTYFEDADNNVLPIILDKGVDWESVKQYIVSQVKLIV